MTHSPVLASRVPLPLPLLLGLAVTGTLPGVAAAQVDLEALGTKIVRVVVGADSAASGFLWQAADQVVTSLHAVPGNDMEIKVGCNTGNVPQVARARVVKVYAKADLVLLKTERPLTNCGVFDARQAQEQKPASLSMLYTFGFHEGASGATAREMKKMDARPEDLLSMLHEPVRSQMASFNIPDVRLPIYYVQGGLLPGYSGAPVVDANNRLVGIVDGGLDKGTSGYNWVIPVENLKYLVVSQESQVPGKVREKGAEHFSSGIASADKRTVLAFELKGRAYRFVRTKIRSLRELAASSDDPAGAARLLQIYGPTVGMEAAERLRFEIFEDLDKGLIIAVPEGEKLVFEHPQPGYSWLKASAVDAQGQDESWNGFIQFEGLSRDDLVSTSPSQLSSDRFVNEAVQRLLTVCRAFLKPGEKCEVDRPSVRAVPFASGDLVIKAGIQITRKPPSMHAYDYYNLAVSGDNAFQASSSIQWSAGAGGLIECTAMLRAGRRCTDVSGALKQFGHLAAAHLTTFASLRQGAEQ